MTTIFSPTKRPAKNHQPCRCIAQLRHQLLVLALVVVANACSRAQDDSAAAKTAQPSKDYLVLPDVLHEVSGLTATQRGTLLTHGDELGLVYELNYDSGDIQPYARFGHPPVAADFEGIASLNNQLYLMTSKGDLYSRPLLAPVTSKAFTKHKTGLKKRCEFEGLDAVTELGLLALVCKKPKSKKAQGQLVIYFWSQQQQAIDETATLKVNVQSLGQEVNPSAIHWDKERKRYIVIAAKQRMVISLSATGELINHGPLPHPANHPQAEGLSIVDGYAYIADESNAGNPARVSRDPLAQLDKALSGSMD